MAKKEACDKCKLNCSLIHARKNDPCPGITTFYKILFGVSCSKDLFLPEKISRMIPVLADVKVHVLEDTNGQLWEVTLGKKDGRWAFRKGWDRFFVDHGLKEGYILAFHYIVDSPFVVQIFDNTGFEKVKFPVVTGKKRKRSNVDVNTNAVIQCLNLSNHSRIPESVARIQNHPMSEDKVSSLEDGNGVYQQVALGDSDIQQVFMINRDAEEDRSLLLDCMNLEMQFSRIGPDGSSDKRNRHSSTSVVASILDENPVSAKVLVSGEPPAKVAAPSLCNNNNVYLMRENIAEVVDDHHGDHQLVLHTSAKVAAPTLSNNNKVYSKKENVAEFVNDHHGDHQSVLPTSAEVAAPTLSNNGDVYLKRENIAEVVDDHHGDHQSVLPASAAPTFSNNNNVYLNRENITEVANDHHGDHRSVLPRENRAHSDCRIESSTITFKRAKIEEAAVSKKHSNSILKLPKSELMELGKSPSCEFMSSEKHPKLKEPEHVDSLNEERLDASAFSFTVMVGSSELLELPTSVNLGNWEKKVVNLKGPDKRVWPVFYYQHKLGIKALTSGWKNFFMSYNLQIGDECAFILENKAEAIFRIDVKNIDTNEWWSHVVDCHVKDKNNF